MSQKYKYKWLLWALAVPGLIFAFQNCSFNGFTPATSILNSEETSENTQPPAADSPDLPTRNPFVEIKATSFNSQSGSKTELDHVGYLDENDYLAYHRVDFQEGARSVSFKLASPSSQNRSIEVRLGGTDGQLAGQITVSSTGSWSSFQSQAVNLNQVVSGLHDVYLVMRGGPDVANMDSFVFSKSEVVTTTPTPPLSSVSNSVDEIIADMQSPNEATSYFGPKFSALSHEGTAIPDSSINRVGGWAMILAEAGGSPSTNTRVAVRDFKVYALRRSTNQWSLIVHNPIYNGSHGTFTATVYGAGVTCPSGCHIGADAKTCDCDYLKSSNLRSESSLAAVSAMIPANIYYQPWAFGTFSYTGDIKALFVTYQVRLVLHDSNGVDDRLEAKYVANAGADWYRDSVWKYDAGVSRWKKVTNDWRSVNFITIKGSVYPNGDEPMVMSADELRRNPPPR